MQRKFRWPYFGPKPVGFLVYLNGELVVPHTVSAKKLEQMERKAESQGLTLEVFGVHHLVKEARK